MDWTAQRQCPHCRQPCGSTCALQAGRTLSGQASSHAGSPVSQREATRAIARSLQGHAAPAHSSPERVRNKASASHRADALGVNSTTIPERVRNKAAAPHRADTLGPGAATAQGAGETEPQHLGRDRGRGGRRPDVDHVQEVILVAPSRGSPPRVEIEVLSFLSHKCSMYVRSKQMLVFLAETALTSHKSSREAASCLLTVDACACPASPSEGISKSFRRHQQGGVAAG